MDKQLRWLMILLFTLPAAAQMPILPGVFGPPLATASFPQITVDAIMGAANSGTTAGTTLTQAYSNTMTACGTGCTVSTGGGATQVTWDTTVTGFTVGAPISGCANLGPVKLTGSTTYAAGALTNQSFSFLNTSTFTLHNFSVGYGITPTSFTAGMCVSIPSTTITGGNLLDQGPFIADLLGNYAIVQWYNSTTPTIRMESGNHAVLHSQGYALPTPGTYLISLNYTPATGSLYTATYSSGGTFSGTGNCSLTFIGGGGTGATGTIAVSSGTPGAITMNSTGQSGYSSTSTSATVATGTATCSGTITVTSTLGGLGTMSIHNATTGALLDQETVINYAGSTVQKVGFGNNENQSNSNSTLFGPIYFQGISTSAATDMFGTW